MDSRLYQDLLETANAQCELIKNNYVNNKCLYNWVCYRFVCQEHVIRLQGGMYMDRYWHLLSPPETKTSFRKLHSCGPPQTDLQTVHVIDGTTKLGFDVPVGITLFYTYMTDSVPNHFSNVSRKVKVNGQPHQSAQLSLPRTISSPQLFIHNPCWNGYSHSHSHII